MDMFFARLKTLSKMLRFRLTVWNVLVIVLTALATLVGVRHGVRVTILNEMDQILIEDLYEIEYKLADAGIKATELNPGTQPSLSAATRRLLDDLNRKARGHEQHGWFVQLQDETGRLLWSSENSPEKNLHEHGRADFQPWTTEALRLVQNRETAGGVSRLIVRVGASTEFLERDMRRIDRLVTRAAAIVLVIAPPIGFWLAGRATRPLGTLIRTAARLKPNQMAERLPIRGTGDELDQLAQTANLMLDRIAAYLAERRDFLANSAHELRTPVAAIRSSAEVALGSQRSKEEYERLLWDVVEECESLETLVNQLLLLAETENLSIELQGKPVSLSTVVERAGEMFQAAAESWGVSLQVQSEPEIIVEGHEHHLRQVLNNLIDNALKFTPPGREISVELRAENGQAVLVVEDTGIGIPDADLPHVFERFFRGDRSHSRDSRSRGTGLGLSICQGVVEAHSGQITVTSQIGQGSAFTITLPQSPVLPDSTGMNLSEIGKD
jgi:heavy metal sensor kinase